MPIHGPRGGFLSTSDWDDLARKIVNGDGLGWSGDPRMELRVGVLKAPNGREGHRLEVHRHNEDGSDTLVGHWLPREQAHVCYDLARMRVDSPGYVSVEDRIDAHNAKHGKARAEEYQAAMFDMMDHALHLQRDRTEGVQSHYGIKSGMDDARERSVFRKNRTANTGSS